MADVTFGTLKLTSSPRFHSKSGLFSPACKFDDASIWQASRSEHAQDYPPQTIMSALLLDAGEVKAGAAAAWKVLFVRLATIAADA